MGSNPRASVNGYARSSIEAKRAPMGVVGKFGGRWCSVGSLHENFPTIFVKFDVWGHTLQGIHRVKVTGRLMLSSYGELSTATDLISVAPVYCLKEPMEFGQR
ncbi:hypothetical protein TNCV_186241 [Trichonephila clavipes]|nr:hypothetical protein TNCV_186241 [Trichonephila clavipes]